MTHAWMDQKILKLNILSFSLPLFVSPACLCNGKWEQLYIAINKKKSRIKITESEHVDTVHLSTYKAITLLHASLASFVSLFQAVWVVMIL